MVQEHCKVPCLRRPDILVWLCRVDGQAGMPVLLVFREFAVLLKGHCRPLVEPAQLLYNSGFPPEGW
jgi:hypothetical protein